MGALSERNLHGEVTRPVESALGIQSSPAATPSMGQEQRDIVDELGRFEVRSVDRVDPPVRANPIDEG
jgi:hypothetical protein